MSGSGVIYSNSKATRLTKQMLEEIGRGRYQPGTLLPTEKQLAENYNVSRRTIRRTLELLAEMDHVIKHPQRGVMVTDRSKNRPQVEQIAFITPALTGDTDPYVVGLNWGIDHAKFAIATFSTHANLQKYQETIEKTIQMRPAGMVITTVPEEYCRIHGEFLVQAKIPCVFLDPHPVAGIACDRVQTSAFENGRKVGKHIIERGCRRVASIMSSRFNRGTELCFKGIRSVLEPAGVEFPEEQIFSFDTPHGFMNPPDPYIDAQRATEALLRKGLQCDVIIAGHDYPAVGILRALLAAGIRVPQEIKLISTMQNAVHGASPLKLTTLDSHREDQGRLAAELLMRRIGGYDGPPEIHYASSDLVAGETT